MHGRVGGRKIPDESRLAASLHARRISEVFIVHYRGHRYKYSSSEPLWGMLLVAERTFKSELSATPSTASQAHLPPRVRDLIISGALKRSDSAGLGAALSLHTKYFRVHFLVDGGELDDISEER